MRCTRQKEKILEYLQATTVHPTAEQVYESVRSSLPRISRGTVYRNLEKLCRKGEAIELYIGGRVSRYDARTAGHGHLCCRSCGLVADVDIPFDHTFHEEVVGRTGFKVNGSAVQFNGVCPACQKKEQKVKKEARQ
ncbi:transcriptional repressor [Dehalogenimonas sp. 4OHTPN]|uniref:Transcriptional repressor n=1 Tax=Dehalogenimonas sp. 4OHTPN TaxID=3166643 RepID=A0AAU8G9K5_9CHLR